MEQQKEEVTFESALNQKDDYACALDIIWGGPALTFDGLTPMQQRLFITTYVAWLRHDDKNIIDSARELYQRKVQETFLAFPVVMSYTDEHGQAHSVRVNDLGTVMHNIKKAIGKKPLWMYSKKDANKLGFLANAYNVQSELYIQYVIDETEPYTFEQLLAVKGMDYDVDVLTHPHMYASAPEHIDMVLKLGKERVTNLHKLINDES